MAIGRPVSLTSNIASKTISVTATASQTLFTVTGGYNINQLSVYRNGVRLVDGTDYTARDGSSVTLLSAATEGDTLEFQIFDTFNVPDAIVANASNQTINGNLTVTGTLNGPTIGIQSAGTVIGTATTLNFVGTGNTFAVNGNIIDVSIAGGGEKIQVNTIVNKNDNGAPSFPYGASATGIITATTFSGNITGTAATFTGNVSIAGTLTYEDVTNVDSVGLVTARSGVRITSGGFVVTGVSTFNSAIIAGSGLTVTGVSTFNSGVIINDGGLNVTAGVSTFLGEQRISTGAEKVHRQSGNTVTLTYNSASSSNVGYTTNPTGDITLNVNGIPTSSSFDDHSITFAVIVNNTGTARTVTAVNLNGVPETIRWAGGSLSAAISGVTTTSGHTIFSFTGINTVGSASTAANYQVLGTVSGGFW